MKLNHCPGCKKNQAEPGDQGSWFPVYTCSDCGYKYCYSCAESNTGRRCPDCGSESQESERDEVHFQ